MKKKDLGDYAEKFLAASSIMGNKVEGDNRLISMRVAHTMQTLLAHALEEHMLRDPKTNSPLEVGQLKFMMKRKIDRMFDDWESIHEDAEGEFQRFFSFSNPDLKLRDFIGDYPYFPHDEPANQVPWNE